MNRSALFAIAFVLVAGTVRAQQVPQAPLGTTPADAAAEGPKVAAMTPRQVAEMRADLMMARKDYAEAAKAYQTILIDDRRNVTVLNHLGMAYQALKELDLAERYYKLALRVDKSSSDTLNNLGTLEDANERYGKAIKYYRKAIAIGNAKATVYTNLGYAYCAAKEYPKALDSFNKALAIDPHVFDQTGNFGSILQLRSSPDPAAVDFTLAKSYAKSGDAEHAARYLKKARDEGYKEFRTAEKDPDFALVIKDPRIQEILQRQPAFAAQPRKPVAN
jgi:tetratricopeptide (TPR) repeat protein